MVQELVDQQGGVQERLMPVHTIQVEGNIGTAYATTGEALFNFGFRPYDIGKPYVTTHGLFIC